MERSLVVIQLIYRLVKALITGEPYYVVLIRPHHQHITSSVNDMSIELITDAINSNMQHIFETDEAPVKLSKGEIKFIKSVKKN